jgi:hypothetical protein
MYRYWPYLHIDQEREWRQQPCEAEFDNAVPLTLGSVC